MSIFCCPICQKTLIHQARSYRCENGHNFDQAKEGYVHLLPVNGKHANNPGDNREMVAARAAFLEQGYYAHLAELLSSTAVSLFSDVSEIHVLDSGCGEGYYTQALYQAVNNKNTHINIYGVDISKDAVKRASKRVRSGEFAVASVYHLPILSESLDLVLNCFSPMCEKELARVLKPGGYLLYVVPAARHLLQLKEVLYDVPYLNEEKQTSYDGFRLVKSLHTSADRVFSDVSSIRALFAMTPYAYRTPREGKERLETLNELLCTCAFDVYVYQREKNEKK